MHTTPTTATRSEFARLQGWKPSYVTELAATGRLVLSPDGKRVLVPESLERIAATRDPARLANTQRHAANRADAAAPVVDIAIPTTTHHPQHDAPGVGYDFQNAKAKREHYAAEREHAAYLKEAGELNERSKVDAAFAHAGATIRAKLESLPSLMPPLLYGQSESAIQNALAEQVERVLRDMADTFARLSKEAKQT